MKTFSNHWKSSTKPRKQRKYRITAPLHIKSKFLNAHLSKELAKKYGTRSIRVRAGDKVKILRGSFKKQEGKVESVDSKKTTLFVEKIERAKKDGSTVKIPIRPHQVMIIELNLSDKARAESLNEYAVKKKQRPSHDAANNASKEASAMHTTSQKS